MKGMDGGGPPMAGGRNGWAIGSFTSPRGDITKSTHFMLDIYNPNWWLDKYDMPEDVKRQIYKVPPQELFSTWEGKAMMLKWSEDLHCMVEPLGLCFFASHMRMGLGPTLFSSLYSAFTGWDMTTEEMIKAGERIFTLFKAHNIRQGMDRKDDNWPARFWEEPLADGRAALLPREKIEAFLDEYYDLRDWDRASGLPRREKLIRLGLVDIADDLQRLGKLTKREKTAEDRGSKR
jgi:aldehyde:ferredoxin oxidoreductase